MSSLLKVITVAMEFSIPRCDTVVAGYCSGTVVHITTRGGNMSEFVKIVHFWQLFKTLHGVMYGYDVFKNHRTQVGETPGGRYAQNPRWPPLETEKAISRLILALHLCVIPVSLCFLVWEIRLLGYFYVSIIFRGYFAIYMVIFTTFPLKIVMLDD